MSPSKSRSIKTASASERCRQLSVGQIVNLRQYGSLAKSKHTPKPILAKARGVVTQHFSITDFAKIAVPIPPPAEQTRIVAEVERRLSVVEELEAVVTTNLQRATRLRQAVLKKAFNCHVS